MTSSLDTTVDLMHYLRLIWRRKGIILLCAVTSFCAALIALTRVPNEYESEVTLLVGHDQPLTSELQRLMGGMRRPTTRRIGEERMAMLIGRIRSRPFLEQVIRMLRMDEDPRVRELAEERCEANPGITTDEMVVRILVENLQSRMRFSASGPGIYKVIVADYSAQDAQLLARWVSELFVRMSGQDALERIRVAHEFGAEQLGIYEHQLRRSEEALEQYKESLIERTLAQSIVREDNLVLAEILYRRIADDVSMARIRHKPHADALAELGLETDQLSLLEYPEIRDLSASFSASRSDELMNRLAGGTSAAGGGGALGDYGALRRDLLHQVETVTANRFPEASPGIVAVVARFVFSRTDLEVQLEAAEMLRGAIDEYKRQAKSAPEGETELNRLENEVVTNRELLESFRVQLVASDVSQAVEKAELGRQVEILDPASFPLTPSRPNRRKILLAALLLGPLVGVGIAFVSETMDPIMRSLEDFTRVVPEPILGTTPLLSRLVTRRPWLRRHWILVTVTVVVLVTGTFFFVRGRVLRDIVAVGVPVRVVNPEGVPDENP